MSGFDSLKNRDYTLILDKSGSMSATDQSGGRSRWEAVQESALALARKCEQFDPDGITVYLFSSRFKRYDDVTSSKVEQIFMENDPIGSTNLASVLWDAAQNYFHRKATGKTKAGETILVVTDGAPDDRRAVIEAIIRSTEQMESDEELAITFLQIGSDSGAKQFLTALDDQIKDVGAKFDICDTITMDDMADLSLAEVLINAIAD
ncbi:VWA domain-containing protein [Leptolyngbya sp. FACHB-17]|uniref:vWA domain-containing protein n=1 Tax=unclassified Leptolyngbya TaxID=2650499 RepID=UPI0016803D3F|nr:VWA domain-containing protein [Leptolyngbya sp. FACHB-17]MBD2079513.1 VWA domain-containing protein [Leptolyngbya sp. FACHB-17]